MSDPTTLLLSPSILQRQALPSTPAPTNLVLVTNGLKPPMSIYRRLAHFSDQAYNLDPSSHLMRLMKVLLGDAGAGQLRKRAMLARLQSKLTGSHFYDLDGFWGAIFSTQRSAAEALVIDPSANATTAQWAQIRQADASFRSRIYQLGRAVNYGASPTGMQLAAEAILGCPCDVFENYLYQTTQIIANAVDRITFVIQPHRAITTDEEYDVRRVINQIKPAGSTFTVSTAGVELHIPIDLRGLSASSEFWDIIQQVTTRKIGNVTVYVPGAEQPRPPFGGYLGEVFSYNSAIIDVFSSLLSTGAANDQLLFFPDGSTQVYPANQAAASQTALQLGYYASEGILTLNPITGRAMVSGSYLDANSNAQITRDAGGMATLYMNGIDIATTAQALDQPGGASLFQSQVANQYWSGNPRAISDTEIELLTVHLSDPKNVNHVEFDLAHFPQYCSVEYLDPATSAWVTIEIEHIADSNPTVLSSSDAPSGAFDDAHPQHDAAGGDHWQHYIVDLPVPVSITQLRLRMWRDATGSGPGVYTAGVVIPVTTQVMQNIAGYDTINTHQDFLPTAAHPAGGIQVGGIDIPRPPIWVLEMVQTGYSYAGGGFSPQPYSLGVRNLNVGYKITAKDMLPVRGDPVGVSTDLFGSVVTYVPYEEKAMGLLADPPTQWRCEPQPVSNAVVNFFVDTRDSTGNPQLIDRFYVEPTHVGVHATFYYSNDIPSGKFTPTDEDLPNGAVFYKGNLVADISSPVLDSRYLDFDPAAPAYITVDNTALQLDTGSNWWTGLSFKAGLAANIAQVLFDYAGTTLKVTGNVMTFTYQNGTAITLPVTYGVGDHVKVVVGYQTAPTTDYPGTVFMSVSINGGATATAVA